MKNFRKISKKVYLISVLLLAVTLPFIDKVPEEWQWTWYVLGVVIFVSLMTAELPEGDLQEVEVPEE